MAGHVRENDSYQVAVVAFSARSLAEATAISGPRPLVADCFGDQDTRASASAFLPLDASHESACLATVAEIKAIAGRQALILLGGGAENWTCLTSMLAENFHVLGAQPRQMAEVRKIDFLQRTANASGVAFPRTFASPVACERQSLVFADCINKPFNGAGGVRIHRSHSSRPLSAEPFTTASTPTGFYLQELVDGRSLGASFLLGQTGTQLVGITSSLSSHQWPGPSEFIYRGSLGPLPISDTHRHQLLAAAEYVQRQVGILGWIQMDLILDGGGQLWLLEINPRWTAGMEIFVMAGTDLVQQHAAACGFRMTAGGGVRIPKWKSSREPTGNLISGGCTRGSGRSESIRMHAKAVYYAESDVHIDAPQLRRLQSLAHGALADIPSGLPLSQRKTTEDNSQQFSIFASVPCQQPILTLKAQIEIPDADLPRAEELLLAELRQRRQQVDSILVGGQ
ncbi:MAG: ATP-grasp domain-containing protein [Planctomycetales bacterium]|nr:ATP-grasp domain-containing protein [Planctomycetales bacterium]